MVDLIIRRILILNNGSRLSRRLHTVLRSIVVRLPQHRHILVWILHRGILFDDVPARALFQIAPVLAALIVGVGARRALD